MFSIPPDRPIDPVTLDVLHCVDRVALELRVEYFVVGAMARDILLTGVFGLKTGRATRDVDLGIVVQGWAQFEAVKAHLVSTGDFTADEKRFQRLYHPRGASYPLDLIPFGGVERRPNEIVWPPDGSKILNVAGYGEALSSAVLVEVEPGFIVRVASLPGLAIMKLIAWADRGVADRRDATDLATLLHRYADAGNEDRLFGAEIQVLESTNYDLDLAGARLLGVDAARIATPATRGFVLDLLDDPVRIERLVLDLSREMRATEDPVAKVDSLLAEFKLGFRES
jgi:predicted nucleotidyltransferase